MTGFNESLANDGKLKLSWDWTRPLDRGNPDWPEVERKARGAVQRNALDENDEQLILDMLGLENVSDGPIQQDTTGILAERAESG